MVGTQHGTAAFELNSEAGALRRRCLPQLAPNPELETQVRPEGRELEAGWTN